MKRTFNIAAALLIGGTLAACASEAQKPAKPQVPTVEEALLAAETVTVTAKVEAVNHAKRLVTLRGPEGRTVTAKVDPAVKNFNKVKVGDLVTVGYRESIVLEIVRGGGAAGASAEVLGARAAPGEKPAGVVAERVRVTAKVRGIDLAKRRIELQGPDGKVQSYPVHNPEFLRDLKVGDDVQVVYTEALAVVVEPAKKKR